MPWSEVAVMDQRRRFIEDVQLGVFTLRALCERYTISRPTAYLWLERFRQGGLAALGDRSHRAHHCPHATPPEIWTAVRRARHEHPGWGPKKLLWLVAKRCAAILPAPSTVAAGSSASSWSRRCGGVLSGRTRASR